MSKNTSHTYHGGGCWYSDIFYCRLANRSSPPSNYRFISFGFRLVFRKRYET